MRHYSGHPLNWWQSTLSHPPLHYEAHSVLVPAPPPLSHPPISPLWLNSSRGSFSESTRWALTCGLLVTSSIVPLGQPPALLSQPPSSSLGPTHSSPAPLRSSRRCFLESTRWALTCDSLAILSIVPLAHPDILSHCPTHPYSLTVSHPLCRGSGTRDDAPWRVLHGQHCNRRDGPVSARVGTVDGRCYGECMVNAVNS
jgi:hypothetical protein